MKRKPSRFAYIRLPFEFAVSQHGIGAIVWAHQVLDMRVPTGATIRRSVLPVRQRATAPQQAGASRLAIPRGMTESRLTTTSDQVADLAIGVTRTRRRHAIAIHGQIDEPWVREGGIVPVPVEPSGGNGTIATSAKSASHQAPDIQNLLTLRSNSLGARAYDRIWLGPSDEPVTCKNRSTLFPGPRTHV